MILLTSYIWNRSGHMRGGVSRQRSWLGGPHGPGCIPKVNGATLFSDREPGRKAGNILGGFNSLRVRMVARAGT